MRRFRIPLFALSILFCMTLTGCGSTLYSLTDEEEQFIVDYSAKLVAKYNKATDVGVTRVYAAEEEETDSSDDESPSEDMNSSPTSSSDLDGSSGQVADVENAESASLTDAIGIEGLEFRYNSYDLETEYNDSDLVMLKAASGKIYLVMNFTVTNSGTNACDLDLLSLSPSFTATINGTTSAGCESTILMDDFTTYQGTLSSGASEDLVLLFSFSSSAVEDISNLELYATVNGQTFLITM